MSERPIKVALFLGSTRTGRMGLRVSKFMQRHLVDKGYDVDLMDPLQLQIPILEQPIHFYQDASKIPKWLRDLDARVRAADAFVVVSAEYNGSMPPALTNIMNHFPPRNYAFKPSAIVTYSISKAGGVMASTQLRTFLSLLGSTSIPFGLAIPEVHAALDEEGNDLNGHLDGRAKRGLDQLDWMVKAFKEQGLKAPVPEIFF